MRGYDGPLTLEELDARPLAVPLRDPFVIASGMLDETRSVEVRAVVVRGNLRAEGLGEAACLPPVTEEDRPDVLAAVVRIANDLCGRAFSLDELGRALDGLGPVARAGVETAVLDALGKLAGEPVRLLLPRLLPGPAAAVAARAVTELETDVTVSIGNPDVMAERAREWVERGFRHLKVKVGKDLDADARALEAMLRAAPSATFRIDANAGYTVQQALALSRATTRMGLPVDCWEQPCAADDLDGLRELTRALDEPVIADESAKRPADVEILFSGGCADGVNLKLVKSGGLLASFEMGLAARRRGMKIMVGGMVETRLGMTAAAHVACALGGVDYVDLDTAWLLADDPYEGGYVATGPRYRLPGAPGLGIQSRRWRRRTLREDER